MEFVNRQKEMERLDALVSSGRQGLVTVWGRRRIGKTRLLLAWCRNHQGIYAVADLSAEPVQRRYFAEVFARRFPGFGEVEYPSWRVLLEALARESRRAGFRGPLVLDEFPYWVEGAKELPSVLQHFLDHAARDAGLLLAIAGSSQHMMQGLTLNPSAPLYGRSISAIKLGPMSPAAMGNAIRITDPVALVCLYSVLGGVPRYWELAEAYHGNFEKAVEQLILDPVGPLHLEPDRLLMAERPPALSLRPLLDVIGAGAHRISEMAGRLGVPATSLSRPLMRLQEMDLVRKDQPFGEQGRGGKRSLYRIADPFLRLWFRVVAPARAMLSAGNSKSRIAHFNRFRKGLIAATWEDICRASVPELADEGAALETIPNLLPAGRFFRGRGPEWDVVSRTEDGKTLLLGEAKWSTKPVSEARLRTSLRELKRKGVPPLKGLGNPDKIVHVLFVPRLARGARIEDEAVRVVTAAEVVSALG